MICPNCNNEQSVSEGNYGALYTCKSCQAVYFIGFDGKPEFGAIEEPTSVPEAVPQFDQPLDMSTLPPTNLPEAISAVMDELAQTHDGMADINPLQPLTDFNQNEFAVNASPFESLQSESLPFTPLQTSQASSTAAPFAEIAQEISAYGNSETQIAHLNYDLRVSGLDTSELINAFKDVINDSRFGWDMNEIMKTMKAGEIRFQQLNPVKAYILAKRLQFLNIEKTWKQNAVG